MDIKTIIIDDFEINNTTFLTFSNITNIRINDLKIRNINLSKGTILNITNCVNLLIENLTIENVKINFNSV